jgi:hypothetical protein
MTHHRGNRGTQHFHDSDFVLEGVPHRPWK